MKTKNGPDTIGVDATINLGVSLPRSPVLAHKPLRRKHGHERRPIFRPVQFARPQQRKGLEKEKRIRQPATLHAAAALLALVETRHQTKNANIVKLCQPTVHVCPQLAGAHYRPLRVDRHALIRASISAPEKPDDVAGDLDGASTRLLHFERRADVSVDIATPSLASRFGAEPPRHARSDRRLRVVVGKRHTPIARIQRIQGVGKSCRGKFDRHESVANIVFRESGLLLEVGRQPIGAPQRVETGSSTVDEQRHGNELVIRDAIAPVDRTVAHQHMTRIGAVQPERELHLRRLSIPGAPDTALRQHAADGLQHDRLKHVISRSVIRDTGAIHAPGHDLAAGFLCTEIHLGAQRSQSQQGKWWVEGDGLNGLTIRTPHPMRVSLRPYQYIVPIGDEHQHEPFGVIPAKLVRDAGRCIRVPTKDTAPISVRCRLRAVPMRVLNDLQAVLRRNEHPREVVVSGGMIHTAERCAGVRTIDAARFIRGGHELPTLLIRLLRDRTVCAQRERADERDRGHPMPPGKHYRPSSSDASI